MWVLDTDHLTILERRGTAALPLQVQLRQVPISEVGTTIVNYDEQMRGWLSQAAQATTTGKIMEAYALLERHIATFRDLPILPFDRAAATHFETLRQSRIRIGTMDLKIAAVCLAQNATLLTRNLRDFQKVPGLRAQDWSA